jgi:hypothetical protein
MATRRLIKNGSFNLSRTINKKDISVLENKHIILPNQMFTLDLNILEIEGLLLSSIIMHIFKTFIIRLNYQKVSPIDLKEFIIDVCDAYLDVPYHNLHHATNVLHMTYIILDKCSLFEKVNHDILFATLISALVHDIGHPGNNNLFEINTSSELALKYNDLSVLEQYHCALSFNIINKNNLHSNMTHEEFILFRKTIISCILGTDMSHHNSSVDFLKIKKNSGFNFNILDEQILVCKFILHGVDIGNPIQNNVICEEWSRLINNEFENQSIKEFELGLTTTKPQAFCELHFISGEIKYIEFICKPYWKELNDIFPELNYEFCKITNNLNIFIEKLNKMSIKTLDFEIEQYS